MRDNVETFVSPSQRLEPLVVLSLCGKRSQSLAANALFIENHLPTTLPTANNFPVHLTYLDVQWRTLSRAPVRASGKVYDLCGQVYDLSGQVYDLCGQFKNFVSDRESVFSRVTSQRPLSR